MNNNELKNIKFFINNSVEYNEIETILKYLNDTLFNELKFIKLSIEKYNIKLNLNNAILLLKLEQKLNNILCAMGQELDFIQLDTNESTIKNIETIFYDITDQSKNTPEFKKLYFYVCLCLSEIDNIQKLLF